MKKIICFDLDNTVITNNSWYDLNMAMGMTKEEDDKYYQQYSSGLIDYKQWIKIILDIFIERKKANIENIRKSFSSYKLDPHIKGLINNLKSKGYIVILISGSVDILVSMVAEDLGIDYYQAVNKFVFDQFGYIKDIISSGDEKSAKFDILKGFAEKYNFDLKDVICIGDGGNDIELFKATGKGITFSDSKIKEHAWKVIESLGDLDVAVLN